MLQRIKDPGATSVKENSRNLNILVRRKVLINGPVKSKVSSQMSHQGKRSRSLSRFL